MRAPFRRRRGRRRRAFSLNGLAIGVSAFALSFTLVALFVVGSSRAAFVEQNETVAERVAREHTEPVPSDPDRPAAPAPPASPSTAPPSTPAPASLPPPDPVPPAPAAPEGPEVGLTDDAAGTALFSGAGGPVLVPGLPEQKCIRVTYEGSLDPEPVLLYAASVQGELAPYLDLVVEVGSADGGTFGDCSGFVAEDRLFTGTLADFGTAHADAASGLRTWDPSGPGEGRSFRFALTVRDEPSAEGLSAGFGFTWETRG